MIDRFTTDDTRALPVLVLAYMLLMMHFVFSRAFRDSLLNSHIAVASLPGLTMGGTLAAIVLSVLASAFIRSPQRIRIIRSIYVVNALIELAMAFLYRSHQWIYSAYQIEVSASTAISISLLWVLIGDWNSRCNANSASKTPIIMIFGTSAGMIAGFGLVNVSAIDNFGKANMILAATNLLAACVLLFYRDSYCVPRERVDRQELSLKHRKLSSAAVKILAVVTIIAATTSTLLDLVFRVVIAKHYTDQAARLEFLGSFQGFLCMGALLSQLSISSMVSRQFGAYAARIYPTLMFGGSCLGVVLPNFPILSAFRISEYSVRNSAFRVGSEMAYAALPDHVRVEFRPLIEIIGERVGDIIAAGMLALLLAGNQDGLARHALFLVGACAAVLWLFCEKLLRTITRLAQASRTTPTGPRSTSLHSLAHEGVALT
jgi:ATP/ADP translocase